MTFTDTAGVGSARRTATDVPVSGGRQQTANRNTCLPNNRAFFTSAWHRWRTPDLTAQNGEVP
jgi:hypothetical protein